MTYFTDPRYGIVASLKVHIKGRLNMYTTLMNTTSNIQLIILLWLTWNNFPIMHITSNMTSVHFTEIIDIYSIYFLNIQISNIWKLCCLFFLLTILCKRINRLNTKRIEIGVHTNCDDKPMSINALPSSYLIVVEQCMTCVLYILCYNFRDLSWI